MTSGGENEKMNPTPMEKRRTIAITVGDSAGIGPEISLRCADLLKNQSNLDNQSYNMPDIIVGLTAEWNIIVPHVEIRPI